MLILFAELSPNKFCMMTRKSFFIRWLLVRDEKEQEKSVIDIEHIQSGDSQRVSSLEEANLWMREIDAESAEKKTESEK
jgi:cell division protein FtsL